MFLPLRHDADMIARPYHFVRNHLHFFRNFVETTSHEALDGENCVLRVGNSLPFGHLAYQTLAIFGESYH